MQPVMLVAWWLLAAYAHSAQERFALWAVELLHAARALSRRNLAAIRLNLNGRHVELQKELCEIGLPNCSIQILLEFTCLVQTLLLPLACEI